MGWAFVPWLLLIARVACIDKPEGCSDDAWNFACFQKLTCATLAGAGVTCTGIATLDGCATACASPCCVTTTTTTQTVTVTTVTSMTHTETSTSISNTLTMTHTSTETTVTATASQTSTQTATTVTETETVTETATSTSILATTEEPVTTKKPSTTPEIEPASVVRLPVRVVVNEVEKYLDYTTDSRVIDAYKDAMVDVSGLGQQWIALQMLLEGGGNITVSYILTVPYIEGAGGELVPIVPLADVQAKLDEVTPKSFNAMLDKEVAMATGAGTYSQKVVTFEQDISTTADGGGSVSGAHLVSLASTILVLVAPIIGI